MTWLDFQQCHWLLQHLEINCRLLLLWYICSSFSLQKSLKPGEMKRPAWEDCYRRINMSTSVTLLRGGEKVQSPVALLQQTLQWVCNAEQKSDIPHVCKAGQKSHVLHAWAEHQKYGLGRKSLNPQVPLWKHFQISHATWWFISGIRMKRRSNKVGCAFLRTQLNLVLQLEHL